jgi:hypothetical protein
MSGSVLVVWDLRYLPRLWDNLRSSISLDNPKYHNLAKSYDIEFLSKGNWEFNENWIEVRGDVWLLYKIRPIRTVRFLKLSGQTLKYLKVDPRQQR